MSDAVTEGKVVAIHYTLKNADGEVLDSSEGQDPLCFLHGSGNVVVGLEKGLEGKSQGEKFDVVVTPEEGYGQRSDDPPQPVPRVNFPADMEILAGMQFMVEAPDGNMMPIWVASVEDDVVNIDLDHPLAGATLHFSVEIVAIREPTQAEVTHGHPHGLDGQLVH